MIKKIKELLKKSYETAMGEKISPDVFSFLKQLKYVLFGYGAAAFCVFAFEVVLGRTLGAENYGKYALSSIISLFLSLFCTMGVTIAALKYIAEEKDKLVQKKIVTAAFSIIFFLIFIASLMLFIFSPFILKPFSISLDIFYPSIAMAAGFSLYTLSVDVMRGLSLIRRLSFFRITYGMIIIFLLVIFLYMGYVSFKTAIWIISFSYFMVFLMAAFSIKDYILFNIDRALVKSLLKYGIYAMIGGPLFVFLPRIGQLFVNKYLTTADLGVYHAYYLSSVNIAMFFYTTFVVVFFPAASKRREKKPILEKLKKLVLFLVLAGSPALFFAQWLILSLYGKGYPLYYPLMAMFAVSGVLISIYGLFGWLFYSKNISGAKLITLITIFVLVINILLNVYLIPVFSLYGAVLAIIFSYSGGIAVLFLFQKKLLIGSDNILKNNFKKIKICYVASADITLKFILLNHLKFLKEQGYDVYGVCSQGRWVKEMESAGIKVKTISIKRKISPISDIFAFLKMFFYFKKEKFDIVHTHTSKPAFFGQIAARLALVPIVVNTVHGFDFSGEDPFLKRSFFIFLHKMAAKNSDIILSVSRKIIDDSVKLGICKKDKIKYLGDGIDLLRFDPSKFSKHFIGRKKKQLGIGSEKRVIGIVARMVAEKGYLDLFSAFKIVSKQFPSALLLAIGQEEPEKRDAITKNVIKKRGMENNTLFLGERTDMEELYAVMDVFVLPSHREGLGLATVEASSMEKPVIVTDTGGCPETVENGKTGILVSVKSPEEIARAIIYLFSNKETAEQMGRAGREKVLKEFDEKLVFDRIKKEYDRLIEEKINDKSADFKKNF
ncbi:MAG: glycosyltransferase [Candidatus Staskawiczbacteria bacterium]|nr:glycosyltransferase [Candidatus Staskawiczbacteria bacterium]